MKTKAYPELDEEVPKLIDRLLKYGDAVGESEINREKGSPDALTRKSRGKGGYEVLYGT